jgi:hypothetical protein
MSRGGFEGYNTMQVGPGLARSVMAEGLLEFIDNGYLALKLAFFVL